MWTGRRAIDDELLRTKTNRKKKIKIYDPKIYTLVSRPIDTNEGKRRKKKLRRKRPNYDRSV